MAASFGDFSQSLQRCDSLARLRQVSLLGVFILGMIVADSEKPPAADAVVPPPEVATTVPGPTSLTSEPANPAPAEDLPEWEPLTPELVEDEAIRGDVMLRWAVVLLALLIGCRQIVETSTLTHVKTGQYLVAHGFWPPANDVFSATAGEHRWVNLSWLWDLISSGLFAIGEGTGLSLATALLVAATWWLLSKTGREGVSTWFGSILGALTLLACHSQFSGRPETLTLLGLAATFWWLHAWRSSTVASSSSSAAANAGQLVSLWWLVPGFVLWSNLDNRMFLGLTLLLLWGVGELIGNSFGRASLTAAQRSHFWKVVGTCVVASCLNPFGVQSLSSPISLFGTEYPAWRLYVLASSGSEETGAFPLLTAELWQSASRRLPLVAGVAVLAAALVSIVLNARRANLGDVLTFAGFVALAGFASHELAAASVVACAIGTLNAQQWYQSSFRQGYSIATKELLFTRGGRAITVLAFFALAVMAVNQSLFGAEGKRVGIGLSNQLRAMIDSYREATADSFDERTFNFVPLQGDVLLWVGQKPFLDSRLALFAKRGGTDLLSLHDQARRSLAQFTDPKSESELDATGADSGKPSTEWKPIFDRFHLTNATPRLFGGSPTVYFRMLLNPDWRLTHLGAHSAVLYRNDDPAPDLLKYLEQHQLPILKLAFQTKSPAAVRIDWPRVHTSFQKWLSPPEARVSNKVMEAENLMMHLRALKTGQLSIDQPLAVAMAHLAIRKANAGLAESVDDAAAYQIQGEAYSFLLTVENSIEHAGGVPFDNKLRFYQALGAYYQAITLQPKSLFLRDRLLELLQRHNRFDLMLRELKVIEELSPVSDSEDSLEDELRERRSALRQLCENQIANIQQEIGPKLDDGQRGAELAPSVYAAGFVLEAQRLLNFDQKAVSESSELLVLQNLLRLEAGEIETVYGLFEYESESNMAAWRIPAAWTRLAHGEYDKAIQLWESHMNFVRKSSVSAVLATFPMVQSPWHAVGHPSVWPTQHGLLFAEAQLLSGSEISALMWYTAMCQIEAGDPQLAGKTMAGLLETNPDTPLRPLIRFYLFVINDELIDAEPPSDWIPIDGDNFMPDELADAKKE